MKCIICESQSEYYFSKDYSVTPFKDLLGTVEYYKCRDCGFVLSKTHAEMSREDWNALNLKFHHWIESPDNELEGNQPPYAEQALMLSLLGRNQIIDISNMLDYAAGYGTLSRIAAKYFDLNLPVYDPFVQSNDWQYIQTGDLKEYSAVINSAMFEHITRREDLEELNNLVAPDGCLIIHTVICETIPCDSDWFYLYPPVHTAFHTNKSMEILMKQWNYQSSIYSPISKCWILLKNSVEETEGKIAALNSELQTKWFFCKKGFVDYWKGF